MLDFTVTDKPFYRLVATPSGSTFLVYKKDLNQAKMFAMKALKQFGNGGHLEDLDGNVLATTVMSVSSDNKCMWSKWQSI